VLRYQVQKTIQLIRVYIYFGGASTCDSWILQRYV